MATPTPFEPAWQAEAGPVKLCGKGLLCGVGILERHLLDRLSVFVGQVTITVKPRTGEILLGSRQAASAGPSRLLWFRRMTMQLGTQDPNHTAAECCWYGIGLENDRGRFGYRILADGKILEGIPQ